MFEGKLWYVQEIRRLNWTLAINDNSTLKGKAKTNTRTDGSNVSKADGFKTSDFGN